MTTAELNADLIWIFLYVIASGAVLLLLAVSLRLVNMRNLLRQRLVFLEITPPAYSDKSSLATQHLFSVLYNLGGRSWTQQLLCRRNTMSLEIVSSRDHGIRYLVRVPEANVAVVQQHIASYLNDARFQVHPISYRPEAQSYGRRFRVLEIRQSRHFAHPLKAQDQLNQHDPVAYITGAMTQLEPGEAVILQAVLSPYSSRRIYKLFDRLTRGEDVIIEPRLSYLLLSRWWVLVLGGAFALWQPAYGVIAFCVSLLLSLLKSNPIPKRNTAQQQLHDQKLAKVSQHLFRVDIRAYILATNGASCRKKVTSILASTAPLNVPGYQYLYVRRTFPPRVWHRFSLYKFTHRLPSFMPALSSILAASEMADIYHFPYADSSRTENLAKSYSRTLPAPNLLKQHADARKFDIPVGINHHHGATTEIGLTRADRERHAYVIGGTGNGKTTMLLGAMIQDANKGKGFAFIDPHGDAAVTLISHVPEERIKDVIYFSPDDLSHPIGLNLLELREGLTDDELLREKDLVTEATISVFRKIFSEEDEGGHRIEYVLRNAVQTALTQPGATLFTVFDLLNDPKYRKHVVSKLQDKDLKNFWQHEIGKAGDFQRVKMAAGITAKIGRFLFSASAKRILEQPKSSIDFDDIMNSGKVLVCNFSKGLLGEDTSELFGITVLAKLQMAALRRARIKQSDRRPFYLYVDEFQNFATTSFVQMLSEARKYQLFMTLAEQSTSQQKDQRMVQVILANVGTLVCFRTGNPADEKLLLPFFAPHIDPGEIANLPAYNFYMRIAGVKTQEPFSGETILPPEEGSDAVARRVVEYSREHYAGKPAPPSTSRPSSQPKAKPAEKDPDRKPEDRRPQKKHKVAK